MARTTSAELRLSNGCEPAFVQHVGSVPLDHARDDDRYLPIVLTLSADRPARIRVNVLSSWKQQIEVYHENRSAGWKLHPVQPK